MGLPLSCPDLVLGCLKIRLSSLKLGPQFGCTLSGSQLLT
jgi:hypothetical protein